MNDRNDILAVIPTYNNEKTVARVIADVRRYCAHVLVVNDGSTDSTAQILAAEGVGTISYAPNRGKGYAIRRALRYAEEHGYRYMITIDSDGQHFASDIPKFVEEIEKTPDALLVGARNLRSDNMPGKNTFANKFSNFWFRVETGMRLDDTQSGFRLYPVRRMKGMRFLTRRYEFEVEVLVRAAWRGIAVRNIPVNVFYPEKDERVTHFRPGKDFTRISILNTFLVLGALLFYYPWRFLRSLTKENIRRFVADNITRSRDSNPQLAASIGLGIFFGIAPLWGYQMIAAGVTAHFTRLNKAVAILSSNISIPPMIPFILYGSYWTGAQVLRRAMPLSLSDITLERAAADMFQYVVGSFVMAAVCAVAAAAVSYACSSSVNARPAMNKFFIALYDFFESRRTLLYALLGVLVVAMASAALRLRFSENITGFFPDGERKAAAAFSNLKIKDKIAVMINAGEDAADKTDEMMACADSLAARLNADTLFRRYAEVEATFGRELADGMRSFLQGNLPLLLSEADYARMDTLVTPRGIAQAMEGNYRRLLSPVGGFIDEYIYDDPLGLSFGALGKLQELNIGGNYTLCDDYLFSKDMTTLLVFISPHYQSGDTGVGDRLIERIESALEGLNAEYAAAGITADYYGGPAVAAYNARQIKRDMMLTLNVAILIIVAFITFSFRNKFAVLLALIPVAGGALFALALMSLTCHTISSIAVGAGTVVMGIALSYSIHILCHANHCHDPRQIIRDLAYPLTIGSITTIGAFAGLLFTDSQLLRDFGLFASLTLVGTTLFSLVLLPHLIRKEKRGGGSAVLERVERLTGMRPDRNRPLVAAILLLTFICLFFFNRIGFDSDMMHLNYDPPRLAAAQQRLSRLTDEDGERSKVLFITTADTPGEAVASYLRMGRRLDSLKQAGKIDSHAGIASFVVDSAEQQRRLERWRRFWTPQRREAVRAGIREAEKRYGFADGAFDGALKLAEKEYGPLDYASAAAREVFREWIDGQEKSPIFLSHVTLADSCKHEGILRFC